MHKGRTFDRRNSRVLLVALARLGFILWASLGVRLAWAEHPIAAAMPGKPLLMTGAYELGLLGYEATEFSMAGAAVSYRETGKPSDHEAARAQTQPYKSRVVVIKPLAPSAFNGTVVVEWFNVSGGLDVPVEWITAHRELVRSGYAYVGVSAQAVGVEGGPSFDGKATPLKAADPARYGTLSHPGDAYAFDIFSDAGRLLRSGQSSLLLGPLSPKHVLAVGESQSAMYLASYVNAVDPLAKVYDGFLIHSRPGVVASLDGTSLLNATPERLNEAVALRADLRVPVLQVVTETDVTQLRTRIGFYAARQLDTDNLRTWEIAGAAHADNYIFRVGAIDVPGAKTDQLTAAWAPTTAMMGQALTKPMNNGPQQHYVVEAALYHLNAWVNGGQAPARAQPLALRDGTPPSLLLDEEGNARGGVRTPWVDVPISALSGIKSSELGGLVGSSSPYDSDTLRRLYPGGKSEYLKRFDSSLDTAIEGGFLLPSDRAEIRALASAGFPSQ